MITSEMDRLNIHNLIYCMKDNWENWLNFIHTVDRIDLTSILDIQYCYLRLHNDDNEVVICIDYILDYICVTLHAYIAINASNMSLSIRNLSAFYESFIWLV